MNKPSPLQLAMQNRYKEIEWDNITENDIQERDSEDRTLLHYAASDGYWNFIPQKLKDKKYWTTSKTGNTVFMSALLHGNKEKWGCMEGLTEKDILMQNDCGQSIAEDAARRGYFNRFPKSLITNKVLSQATCFTKGDDLIVHLLAKSSQFNCIPKEIITEELLSLKGNYGENLYHILSGERQINLIPEKLLTRKALTAQSQTGVTALHRIAAHRHHLIPEDITLDDLLLKTTKRITVLHSWAGSSGWINIPDKFLTKKSLELKDDYGTCPIDNIIEDYKDGWASRPQGAARTMDSKMKRILEKLSNEKLQELTNIPSLQVLAKSQLLKRKLLKEVSEQSVEI